MPTQSPPQVSSGPLGNKHQAYPMKQKFFAIIICAVLGSTNCFSQLVKEFEVKVGMAIANQTWTYQSFPDLDTKSRLGIDAGFGVEWLSSSMITILTEAHYIQKGMKESIPITTEQFPDGTGQYLTRQPEVNYLSIPILAKYRIDFSCVGLYAIAGPRFDFLVSSKGGGFDVVINKFKKSEIGGTIGAGFEISNLLHNAIGIEVRYSPALQNSYSTQFLTVSNNSVELLLTMAL